MKLAALLLTSIAATIVSFYLGTIYGQGKILRTKRYEVVLPLAFASVEPDDHPSLIPPGTTLYEYRTLGETSNYILFIEMKEMTPLKELQRGERFELTPVSVYPLPIVQAPRK